MPTGRTRAWRRSRTVAGAGDSGAWARLEGGPPRDLIAVTGDSRYRADAIHDVTLAAAPSAPPPPGTRWAPEAPELGQLRRVRAVDGADGRRALVDDHDGLAWLVAAERDTTLDDLDLRNPPTARGRALAPVVIAALVVVLLKLLGVF